jgi:hypothetical protein
MSRNCRGLRRRVYFRLGARLSGIRGAGTGHIASIRDWPDRAQRGKAQAQGVSRAEVNPDEGNCTIITNDILVLRWAVWYYRYVVDCTWNEQEAEIVLRNLNLPVEEQMRFRTLYLNLRDEYRSFKPAPGSQDTETRTR